MPKSALRTAEARSAALPPPLPRVTRADLERIRAMLAEGDDPEARRPDEQAGLVFA